MKLSIAWIFDHINADWKKQDIDFLVTKFNKVVAEIEKSSKINFDLESFAVCKILNHKAGFYRVFIPEWEKEFDLKERDDSKNFLNLPYKDLIYMVHKSNDKINWATLKDFGLDKEGLIPPLDIDQKDLNSNWKNKFESQDVIIEVDNKSITHRPDMWGHRGFAREIAAIMDLPFKTEQEELKEFLEYKKVDSYKDKAQSTKENLISIEIENLNICPRFAGIYFESIENRPSNPFIVSRLLKIEQRPINGIVDLTNYLTQDWSQPVHVYDAQKIDGNKIVARFAKNKEKLTLLDGTELNLTDKDLVIADVEKPLCLAGVMGGLDSGINADTKSVFFESANFDAATIRRTCMRNGLRTESSSRFEKTLDPNQNIEGIFRFLKLAKNFGIKIKSADNILSVGPAAVPVNIEVSHEFLEKRSGLELNQYDIDFVLTRLGFKVEKNKIENIQDFKKNQDITYNITVPTYRSSKDIKIKEDILEEVIRYYGFEKLDLKIPQITKEPTDLSKIFRQRKIKYFLSNVVKMIEQQNYALYDEQFLESIGLADMPVTYQIINPVSQNNKKLLTSLLPGLFKNIKDNFANKESLRFFEIAKIWPVQEQIEEKKQLSGIIFEKKKKVDFYECKNYVVELLESLGIKNQETTWQQSTNLENWALQYQVADIYLEKILIGRAGKVDSLFLSKLDLLPESDAFFFDIDANFLINFEPKITKFEELPKHQETFFDLSLMVPVNLLATNLEKDLYTVSDLITSVKLIDFFEKEDWTDVRSLTFRINLNHPEKTLEKEEIDKIWNLAVEKCKKLGAQLRAL
ncbi:phenylalanine--tRNA ligase subunit beta [Candidatus Babeliales bacterium]|nr:phenylalanine--tRNA ligase subunit beta [Candidatus Babeliales bacterium]MCF7899398.1 phenylalanine--tRNA ligase subunit beta [Candidatus Babeliales bacterium]